MEAAPRDRAVERLLRGLYSAALYLLVPVTVYHLIWRGFRQAEYLERWGERYAAYRSPPLGDGCIWVHAVSVGEVGAAAPLVNALLELRPDQRLLVTTITPTGSARVRALWGDRVEHVYLAYDLSGAVRRFLGHFRPRIALVLETELWPNLLFCCRDAGVPAYIVNARLSERSLRGYRVLRPLLARVLATLRRVVAQSAEDASRFGRLGAPEASLVVAGNLKYDIDIDVASLARAASEFRERIGGRPVWIAASTHPPEEEAVLRMHAQVLERHPDALLLWAPRHPERFAPVLAQARAEGWEVGARQPDGLPGPQQQAFVINSIGELLAFYAAADVAFVGGSLCEIGGHNVLEPAALGVPAVVGPHTFNFAEPTRRLKSAEGLIQADDAGQVTAALLSLLENETRRQAMGQAARQEMQSLSGALARTLDLVGIMLDPRAH